MEYTPLEMENFQMPTAAFQMVLPGGNNYALVISDSPREGEVLNAVNLRDRLLCEGWNVEFLAGETSTLDAVRAGLNWLKSVENGERVLIFINDHSICVDAPWLGTYMFGGEEMTYLELDSHLCQIAVKFQMEKALFVTGNKSGSSPKCDHSIWIENGGLVLASTNDAEIFEPPNPHLADPCDLADLWLGGNDTFEAAWGRYNGPYKTRNP